MARKTPNPPLSKSPTTIPADYPAMLADIKARIRTAQIKAALSVNRELIQLYWDIGRAIVLKQNKDGWGSKTIDRLSLDIQKEFPGIEGFSPSNISRMRAFFLVWRPLPAISAQPVPNSNEACAPSVALEIPWGHNVVLLFKVDDPAQRLWYAQQTVKSGWSRAMLEHWIDSDLYARQGKAANNFKATLPLPQSDLAQQILKDPYNFDFLTLHTDALERDLEDGLTGHITRFLLELGEGFAFVGRQVHLEIDGEDFYIDLLFYHLHLRAFVVIELKARKFVPEYAGKLNFYLSAVDDLMRKPGDAPSIGLILCKTRSKVIAEYALRHLSRPVGVAQYITRLTEKLPKKFTGQLPTVQEIEAELSSLHPKNPPQPARKKVARHDTR